MSKRVQRKSPEDRIFDIVQAVALLTTNRASVTTNDIAKFLGLGCSSHLRGLCKRAVIENRISMRLIPDKRVGAVYKFYRTRDQKWGDKKQCNMLLDCSKTSPQTWADCCKNDDNQLCPAQRLLSS